MAEKGLRGGRVGIELDTYGLTASNYVRVQRVLDGWCGLEDASHVVRRLRLVRSEAELAYVRRAAELADASLLAMIEAARPGAFEGDVNAAGVAVILRGAATWRPPARSWARASERSWSGPPPVPGSSGSRASSPWSSRPPTATTHACLMRTVAVGVEDRRQRRMFEVARAALEAMTEAVRPGRPLGEVDDAHRRVMDGSGFADQRLASCGYSLGATFRPNWMDVPPLLYSGNPMPAQPGMVLFLHSILIDAGNVLAMSLGHTVVVTDRGADVLSRVEPDYVVCR